MSNRLFCVTQIRVEVFKLILLGLVSLGGTFIQSLHFTSLSPKSWPTFVFKSWGQIWVLNFSFFFADFPKYLFNY